MTQPAITDAARIDSQRRDEEGVSVALNGYISLTAAVHVRGALEKSIAALEEQQGGVQGAMWATWPLRAVAEALTRSIDEAA